MEVATSTLIVALGFLLHLLLEYFWDFKLLAVLEGQNRLTEKPEPEDLAVHNASDSFKAFF